MENTENINDYKCYISAINPGTSWVEGTTFDSDGHSNGHTLKMGYQANSASNVRFYTVSLASDYTPTLLNTTTWYPAGELYKTVSKDENWITSDSLNHTTETYTNKQGQVVLKRTYKSGVGYDTYYVYDDYGNLTYVLPPKANAGSGIPSSTLLSDVCYQYQYDYRKPPYCW